MHKRFLIAILCFFFLITMAHAGRLLLEAELSDEQIKAVQKTFVEPYQKEAKNPNSTWSLMTPDDTFSKMSYPILCSENTMAYSAGLIWGLAQKDAEALGQAYMNTATKLGKRVLLGSSQSIIFADPENGKIRLYLNSNAIETWNDSVRENCSALFNSERPFGGALCFGKI